MQNIEESALSTYRQTIPLWLRNVDDTFTAVRQDEIVAFHRHLNGQNTDIQFTREVEENGKLPFLDCQETDTYRQITGRVFLQPDITQSRNHQDSHATSLTSMQHDRQFIWREQVPWPCFFQEQP